MNGMCPSRLWCTWPAQTGMNLLQFCSVTGYTHLSPCTWHCRSPSSSAPNIFSKAAILSQIVATEPAFLLPVWAVLAFTVCSAFCYSLICSSAWSKWFGWCKLLASSTAGSSINLESNTAITLVPHLIKIRFPALYIANMVWFCNSVQKCGRTDMASTSGIVTRIHPGASPKAELTFLFRIFYPFTS